MAAAAGLGARRGGRGRRPRALAPRFLAQPARDWCRPGPGGPECKAPAAAAAAAECCGLPPTRTPARTAHGAAQVSAAAGWGTIQAGRPRAGRARGLAAWLLPAGSGAPLLRRPGERGSAAAASFSAERRARPPRPVPAAERPCGRRENGGKQNGGCRARQCQGLPAPPPSPPALRGP